MMQIHRQLEDTGANIHIDDDALVRQCQSGDTGAMGRLIVRYQDRIFNVILKICTNTDDAAELTQQTFVKAIDGIGNFQARSSFYTWLFRIAVNLTLNYCKRKAILSPYSLEESVGSQSSSGRMQLRSFLIDEKAADPSVLAENREIAGIINWAVGQLSREHRAVIVLRDIEAMSYDEITEILQIGMGTLKSRLARARLNLKKILESVL